MDAVNKYSNRLSSVVDGTLLAFDSQAAMDLHEQASERPLQLPATAASDVIGRILGSYVEQASDEGKVGNFESHLNDIQKANDLLSEGRSTNAEPEVVCLIRERRRRDPDIRPAVERTSVNSVESKTSWKTFITARSSFLSRESEDRNSAGAWSYVTARSYSSR